MAISMPALFGLSSLARHGARNGPDAAEARPARAAGSWLVAKIVCGVAFGALAYLPMIGLASPPENCRWTPAPS